MRHWTRAIDLSLKRRYELGNRPLSGLDNGLALIRYTPPLSSMVPRRFDDNVTASKQNSGRCLKDLEHNAIHIFSTGRQIYFYYRPVTYTTMNSSIICLGCGLSQTSYHQTRTHCMPFSGNPVRLPINTLRSRRNGPHCADDFFKYIFLNENTWISIEISLKFVPMGPKNNIAALVQIMAWRRPGDKPLSEPMMVRLLTHKFVTQPQWVNSLWRIYATVNWAIIGSDNGLSQSHYQTSAVISSIGPMRANFSEIRIKT